MDCLYRTTGKHLIMALPGEAAEGRDHIATSETGSDRCSRGGNAPPLQSEASTPTPKSEIDFNQGRSFSFSIV
jgi:hypothetical protein